MGIVEIVGLGTLLPVGMGKGTVDTPEVRERQRQATNVVGGDGMSKEKGQLMNKFTRHEKRVMWWIVGLLVLEYVIIFGLFGCVSH